MRFTQLNDWLNWVETLHPVSIEFGLDRIQEVAERGKLNHFTVPVITITGTNGKGSCVALLENILHAHGYQTASYTSPHLLRFNERVKFNAQPCSDAALCEAFAAIEALRGDVSLTYFEFTALVALWLFQQQAATLSVVILEVGVGGRLDAVNIVDADIAIITNIGLDHCNWLGDTREKIAAEKAGILRNQSTLIYGDSNPPENLSSIIKALDVTCYRLDKDFSYKKENNQWSWSSNTLQINQLPLPNLALQNAAISLMALTCLQEKLPTNEAIIRQILPKIQLPGRFQRLQNTVEYVLDVAHNPDSAQLLAENLSQFPCKGRIFAIIAMLQDKDVAATIAPLSAQIDQWFIAGLDVERGADAASLASQIEPLVSESVCQVFDNVLAAHDAACQQMTDNDCLLVFGSFYTVAAVLPLAAPTVT